MYIYLILEFLSILLGISAFGYFLFQIDKTRTLHKVVRQKWFYLPLLIFILSLFTSLLANRTYAPHFAMPTFMHSHAPDGIPASIPFTKIASFLMNRNHFEKIEDIGASPNSVPKEATPPDADGIVRITLTAKEVISEVAPDIYFNYWTYNNQVPGPMLRIREGDTVELTLTNDPSSLHNHNIDLHAVTGPGGGATLTDVAPGDTKTFRWKALNPGLYVYHCAMPNVSTHNSHGQYGMILVDPSIELAPVDQEFYIMQGELYTLGQLGKRGLVPFDSEALLDGIPNYITFNGRVESTPRLQAKVGETIRIYVGNGGVNLISSFHIIGEIFDTVYPEGNLGGAIEKNVQTTAVLPGGSSIVEFKLDVPGKYLLVDHALARMNKGAWAVLEVTGDEQPNLFRAINADTPKNMEMH